MKNCLKCCGFLACDFHRNKILIKYHSGITNTDKKEQLFSKKTTSVWCWVTWIKDNYFEEFQKIMKSGCSIGSRIHGKLRKEGEHAKKQKAIITDTCSKTSTCSKLTIKTLRQPLWTLYHCFCSWLWARHIYTNIY